MILNSDKYFRAKKEMEMFKVSQLDRPDMTVHVNSGTIIYNNQLINFSERNTDIISAPRIGTWLVVVSINKNAELVYTYGIQSTEEKQIPKLPDDCFHLCVIEMSASTEFITNDMIYDLRQVFNFSYENEKGCTYKCGLENDYAFTKEDREQLKKYYDKLEDLSLEIDKIRLMFSPQKEYTVLTDSGLEYVIRFKDDGTPYFKRKDSYEDNPSQEESNKHTNYKFVYGSDTMNIVTPTCDDFVQIAVKVKSFDNMNKNIPCTLFIRCNDTTIHSSNYEPHYQENEFKIDNIEITKAGFFDRFNFKFHNTGLHQMSLYLYNNETQGIVDKANVGFDVQFIKQNVDD